MAIREQLALVDSCIARAAQLANLSNINQVCGGASDGDGLIWTWRRLEAPDTIIAAVDIHMLLDDFVEGVEIKMSSGAYCYEDRDRSFSRTYWGRYLRFENLAPQVEGIANELGEELRRAWQELPHLVSLMPHLKNKSVLLEELRRRGLLGE